MSLSDVGKVVNLFRTVSWRWDFPSWQGVASGAGLVLEENVAHRYTYKVPDGGLADVFVVDGEVDSIEITLEAFLDSGSLDDSEYSDKVDEFYDKFYETVNLIKPLLGEPVFCDGAAAAGFPEDQEAEWLALWRLQTARVMIQQKHEDRELPFRICLVVAPA